MPNKTSSVETSEGAESLIDMVWVSIAALTGQLTFETSVDNIANWLTFFGRLQTVHLPPPPPPPPGKADHYQTIFRLWYVGVPSRLFVINSTSQTQDTGEKKRNFFEQVLLFLSNFVVFYS